MVKDVDLFAAAMHDAKPLRGRKRPAAAAVAAAPKAPGEAPSKLKERPVAPASPRVGATMKKTVSLELTLEDHNFDRDISRSLSRGKLVPQDSLDLHGMTLATAERAVAVFLDGAAARDLRVVLIVTGKGLRLQAGRMVGGRIRAEFIGWLNRADNRHRVRAVRPAHPRHGGGGAFYVLLRRRSSASGLAASRSEASRSKASRSVASSRFLRAIPQR
ncbi:hypothetical protein BH11PSE3_BH11PSE3_23170 [soil metagenome]